jgi:hypothetical protein
LVVLAAVVVASVLVAGALTYRHIAYAHTCLGQLASSYTAAEPVARTDGSKMATPTQAHTLIQETIDWAAWCNLYGNPFGSVARPLPGTVEFDRAYAGPNTGALTITRYYPSGGMFASHLGPGMQTVGTMTRAQAYRYALTVVASTGGLPDDAMLVYNGGLAVTSGYYHGITNAEAQRPRPDSRMLNYTFGWVPRPSSSIIFGNSITIYIDLVDGRPNVEMYRRLWRTLGASPTAMPPPNERLTPVLPQDARAAGKGLCAEDSLYRNDVDSPASDVAFPCREYIARDTPFHHYFVSDAYAQVIGTY